MSRVKGQHHVWRLYLAAWEQSSRLYFRRDGQILPSKAINVAKKHLFYKPVRLEEADILTLRGWMIDHTDGDFRKLQERTLWMFTYPFQVRDQAESIGASPEDLAKLDQTIEQMIEKYHSAIEDHAIQYLVPLQQGRLNFLKEETWIGFSYFIAQQYTRTRRMRDMARNSVDHPLRRDHLDRIWTPLSQLMANVLGQGIYVRRKESRCVILKSNSSVKFITGDQPIINLQSEADGNATGVELYYPISPSVAFLISPLLDQHPNNEEHLSAEDVHAYNMKIRDHSYQELYGSDPLYLKAL